MASLKFPFSGRLSTNIIYTVIFLAVFFALIRPARVFVVQQHILPLIEKLDPATDDVAVTQVARTGFTMIRNYEKFADGDHVNPYAFRHTFTLLPNLYFAFGGLFILLLFGAVRPVIYLTLFQVFVAVITVICLYFTFRFSVSWIHVLNFFQHYVSLGGTMIFFVWVYQQHIGARRDEKPTAPDHG